MTDMTREIHLKRFTHRCVRTDGKEPLLIPRHHSVVHVLQYFTYDHLPEDLQAISKPVGDLAVSMANELPENPELTAGLRKLLEANDALVRCAKSSAPFDTETYHFNSATGARYT